MRKARKTLKPTVEPVERRWLPSGGIPVLTTQTYHDVAAGVQRVARDLARSQDIAQAAARLETIASMIPNGASQLAPVWDADLAVLDPHVRGSSVMVRRQLLADLRDDVATGVAQGEFRLVGPGASSLAGGGAGTVQASRDSVNLVNQTGLNITVTAFLNNTQRSITRKIAINSSVLFNFDSATNNPISINIARTDGQQPPPPANGILLNRPVSGYFGKNFTIAVFQGFYSVSV